MSVPTSQMPVSESFTDLEQQDVDQLSEIEEDIDICDETESETESLISNSNSKSVRSKLSGLAIGLITAFSALGLILICGGGYALYYHVNPRTKTPNLSVEAGIEPTEAEKNAATKIQSVRRGMISRKSKSTQILKETPGSSGDVAVPETSYKQTLYRAGNVLIQNFLWYPRTKTPTLLVEAGIEPTEAEKNAATKIQSVRRGMISRKSTNILNEQNAATVPPEATGNTGAEENEARRENPNEEPKADTPPLGTTGLVRAPETSLKAQFFQTLYWGTDLLYQNVRGERWGLRHFLW